MFFEASSFKDAIACARTQLLYMGEKVDTGRWQGVPTEGKPDLVTTELLNFGFSCPVDKAGKTFHEGYTLYDHLSWEIVPNQAWADEHFAERIGGKPMNPDPSHERWPWWRGQDSTTKDKKGEFTHTYSERFWPKRAGWPINAAVSPLALKGIRYTYGDLNDLLDLMLREPYGRQAFLPIFFPEDTGAVHGGRIPCTLGYWFVLRDSQLHMTYYIRSCDYVRHFRDDIYLAVRLQLWVLDQLREREVRENSIVIESGPNDPKWDWQTVRPGTFTMHIGSLHFHEGDRQHV